MAGKGKKRWQLWASAAALVVATGLLALILTPAQRGTPLRGETKSVSLARPPVPSAPVQPDEHRGEDALAPLIEQATADKPEPKPAKKAAAKKAPPKP